MVTEYMRTKLLVILLVLGSFSFGYDCSDVGPYVFPTNPTTYGVVTDNSGSIFGTTELGLTFSLWIKRTASHNNNWNIIYSFGTGWEGNESGVRLMFKDDEIFYATRKDYGQHLILEESFSIA